MLDEVANSVRTRGRIAMPPAWPDLYAKLSQSESEAIREQAQFVTVKFGDKSIFPALRAIALDAQAKAESRQHAIEALLSGKDEKLPALLQKLLDDARLRSTALRGLAAFEDTSTPQAILSRYGSYSDAEKGDAIATLAARVPYALALLDSIEAGAVPRGDLKAFTVVQLQQFKDENLLARLNAVWGSIRTTPQEKQQQIATYKASLAPTVLAGADLSNGRVVYTKNCGKCHKLFGEGGAIGPDITGSNRANVDYILQNILDPSALVGKDYQTTLIVTDDGRVLTGLIKEENDSAVVLQTANEVVVVEKATIDERKLSEQSLMPEGQLKEMPATDIRDLVAYLASPSQAPLPGEGPRVDPQTGKVAGALEGESLKVASVTGGAAAPQKMGTFSKGKWSGGSQLWWTGANPGDRLVLELPVAREGRYELFAVMTKARDYGIVRLSLDDQPLGQPFDLFNFPDVTTTGVVSLGVHELTAGAHRFGVETAGISPDPRVVPSRMFGLDYLYLAPQSAETQQASR
jgi:putative heme-binding domain-containing protein